MEPETAAFKWEGKQAAQVNGVTAEQAWLVLSDFCNVHEWFPTVDTCRRVEGTDGQTGLVRYCASNTTKKRKPDGLTSVWSRSINQTVFEL
ncbi:hypothetical protein Bca52824_089554 [Brassica carinata]|uniref:Uncharacterized protein n=1 Tax=Brassica carinata TaxID=52824 RepID=A0A8X7PDH5_BRACI|nr:hypothetical protein Bca52824_089554 [Brassica carinata]